MLDETAHGTPLYPVQIYRDRLCGVYVCRQLLRGLAPCPV